MLAERAIPAITGTSLERLVRAFGGYLSKGLATSSRIASGDYSPDPLLDKLPEWETHTAPAAPKTKHERLSFDEFFGGWWAEAKATGRSESTHESYSNSFKLLGNFLGHRDAAKVTTEDILRYKDHRLTAINPKTGKPVSPKTIKGSDLTAYKSVFGRGVANRKLAANPEERR